MLPSGTPTNPMRQPGFGTPQTNASNAGGNLSLQPSGEYLVGTRGTRHLEVRNGNLYAAACLRDPLQSSPMA